MYYVFNLIRVSKDVKKFPKKVKIPMKIICVDDEPIILEKLCKTCREIPAFLEVKGFSWSEEALAYVKENKVDIAFLDVDMPIMNGISLAEKMKDFCPAMAIIYTTAYPQYALEAFQAGAIGYLLKPVKKEDILKEIEKLYGLKQLSFHRSGIYIHTFGNFEVYCDGEPIRFKYSMTKALLAYLVDRNGADCNVAEIEAVLFEENMHESYLRVLRKDLIDRFHELGKKDVIRSRKGFLGINKDKVECDYFEYLAGILTEKPTEYLTQYSFGEVTLAGLLK